MEDFSLRADVIEIAKEEKFFIINNIKYMQS